MLQGWQSEYSAVKRALREPWALKRKLLGEISKLSFWLTGTWRELWVSLNVLYTRAQYQQPFPDAVCTRAVPSPAVLLGEPWPLPLQMAIPKICCGLQRGQMECPAGISAVAGECEAPSSAGQITLIRDSTVSYSRGLRVSDFEG